MVSKKSPSSIDRHIGSRIRMRRILIGMSQERLGERLGVTFQQVQKYEKGTNRVGSGRLHEIGGILDVPVSFFFEGREEGAISAEGSRAPSVAYDPLSQKDSLRLLQAFNAIADQNVRRAIVNMVRALAGQTADDETGVSQPSPAPRKAFSHSS